MKALNEYFLMVVFTLLLDRIHVFAIFKVLAKFPVSKTLSGPQRVFASAGDALVKTVD